MLTLIADNLPRFMTCNGSVNMPHHQPFNTDDTVRNEGIAAHWLIEQVHKGKFTPEELVNRKAENGVFITAEMVEHVTPFLDATRGFGSVECVTSYGDQRTYQVNGRADHIGYVPQTARLYVSDFKYGWGTVEPENNWTLISHALGWIFTNPQSPVEEIVFSIYQPRPHHSLGKIRQYRMSIGELWQKWEELNRALCFPATTLVTSPHCKRCPALATCPAALQAGMNAVDVSENAYVANIDNEALGSMLANIDRALKMLEESKKAYSELALHRLKEGQIIQGYIAEKELTNKQWKPGLNVEVMKMFTGLDLGKKPELVTPSQAVKAGLTEEIVNSFCERREKGVKLARVDANVAVKKMFKNII